MLHGNEGVELLADLVGQALAPSRANGLAKVAVVAAQADHGAGKGVPLFLQTEQALQAVNLLRVVRHHLLQALDTGDHLRLGHLVGIEKAFFAGEQEAAHAGFHVDRQLDRLVGVVDHPIGVLDPLDGRQQVADDGDEHHRTEQSDPQGQADVAGQQLAKAALID
ncbi:hypothetical protein D3C81_939280 [compost metagenome]